MLKDKVHNILFYKFISGSVYVPSYLPNNAYGRVIFLIDVYTQLMIIDLVNPMSKYKIYCRHFLNFISWLCLVKLLSVIQGLQHFFIDIYNVYVDTEELLVQCVMRNDNHSVVIDCVRFHTDLLEPLITKGIDKVSEPVKRKVAECFIKYRCSLRNRGITFSIYQKLFKILFKKKE